MRFLVTGGAGFIGRWVIKKLLEEGQEIHVLDNLSNSTKDNLEEFAGNETLKNIEIGTVEDRKKVHEMFSKKPDICIHLASQINVQESIDNPDKAFSTNIIGTYNILEEARKLGTKVVVVGTCMVYDTSSGKPINEEHPVKPLSPYAATKLAAEHLAFSYNQAYNLPVTVVRPFNTYGPFQKTDAEGGVVAVFIKNSLAGKTINVFGDGEQTRDFLYVEDCATFITQAAMLDEGIGHIINAGTGHDVSINNLAQLICKDASKIKHIEHPHPQSEIKRLVCDSRKAQKILGWSARTSLEEGIKKTTKWIEKGEYY